MRLPIFVETITSERFADVEICRKTRAELFRAGVSPLPFASTNDELRSVLEFINKNQHSVALFVVNVYATEHLFPELDTLMGETPALFLRRDLYTHTPTLEAAFGDRTTTTSAYLAGMTPRLASVWSFGPRNSGLVAERAAKTIRIFLENNEFSVIENNRTKPRTVLVKRRR